VITQELDNNMGVENKVFLNEVFKVVKFLYGVFIITDIAILIRALLMNYGEKLEMNNVITTIVIFGAITFLLFLLKTLIKVKLNKS
tara:strand:- start:4867 stop:5124 length:258 start_codon:yes stop_codon:yes gene_type:complete